MTDLSEGLYTYCSTRMQHCTVLRVDALLVAPAAAVVSSNNTDRMDPNTDCLCTSSEGSHSVYRRTQWGAAKKHYRRCRPLVVYLPNFQV